MRYTLCFSLVAVTLFISGCGKSVPQRWQNFKAYYNTFYNAERSFEAGYEKNQNLELDVVEGRPIRMFFPPGQAGYQELQNAIDKGADILRDHDRSDFVEPSILLIGKSYFFRKEFFSAQQKFGELRRIGMNSKLVQAAVFWETRTLFEMGLYSQAVTFAEQQLLSLNEWDPHIEAETALILAESHVSLGDFMTAVDLIDPALPQIKDKDLKARGFFLLGQLLQFEGNYELASKAFDEVIQSKRAYEMIYQAQKQQAVSLRESEDYKEAEKIFNRLIKDDKNIDVRSSLRYELASTYLKAGKVSEAQSLYEQLLRDELIRPDKLTQAQTYYGIAEIYKNHFEDYLRASAYFDSAAAISLTEAERPPDFDAQEMAQIFGEYSVIYTEITELDSLIHLALLPKSDRDSVIQVIRTERKKVLEEEIKRREAELDKLVVVDTETDTDQQMVPGLGFLNHMDPRRSEDAKIQFKALWRDRPLVDNWRRMEAVRSAPALPQNTSEAVSENQTSVDDLTQALVSSTPTQSTIDTTARTIGNSLDVVSDGQVVSMSDSLNDVTTEVSNENDIQESLFIEDPMDPQLGITLSDIPLDSLALEMSLQRFYSRNYELANLMYFSLEMEDRAGELYRMIADSAKDSQLRTQSLYVLSTILEENNRLAEAKKVAEEVLQTDPESLFAIRIAEQFGLDSLRLAIIQTSASEDSAKGKTLEENRPDISAEKDLMMIDSVSKDSSISKLIEADTAYIDSRLDEGSLFVNGDRVQLPPDISTDSLLNVVLLNRPLRIAGEDVKRSVLAEWVYLMAKQEDNLDRKPYLIYEAVKIFAEEALELKEDLFEGVHWKKVRAILEEFNQEFPNHVLSARIKEILLELTPKVIQPDSNLVPAEVVQDSVPEL